MNVTTFHARQHALHMSLQVSSRFGMVTSRETLYYLTGLFLEGHERLIALLMYNGRSLWVVPKLEEETVSVTGLPVESYSDDVSFEDVLTRALFRLTDASNLEPPEAWADGQLLQGKPWGGVAVEKKLLSLFFAEQLEAALLRYGSPIPSTQWFDLDEIIAMQRMVKDTEEQKRIEEAARRLSSVLDMVIAEDLKPGMREIDVVQAIEARARRMGIREMSFPTIVLSGARSSLPHGTSSEALIEAGFLLIDLGFAVEGYHADMTRTYILGTPDARSLDMLTAVLDAQEKAIRHIRLGIPYGELDQVARAALHERGYDAYFTHRLGHGLGLSIHERPSIHGRETLTIAPGHVFTIEPGIYIPGVGGVRIEDDVLIGVDGTVKLLTTSSKKLDDLIRPWP